MPTADLHPEIVPLASFIPSFELDRDALASLRTQRDDSFRSLMGPLSDAVVRSEHRVRDDADVVVRVHRPVGLEATAACLYSIHGGGYVMGSYDMDDPRFDRYCQRFGCVGVSVEYRLAPETPYPGPLEDCYAGLAWTVANAEQLGIDPARIGIAGVSAGGGLAAGLSLLVRDRAELPVAFQLLECPMIDDRQQTVSSRYDDLLIWSRQSNTFGWQCYLGDRYGTDDIPGYAAASRAEDLSGLPPAFVITGGADGFRDENVEYATRLAHAGVPTDLLVLAGAPHGVQMFVGTELARRWNHAVEDWLTPHLRTPA